MYPAEPRISTVAQFISKCGLIPTQVLSLVDYRADCDEVFFTGSLIEGFGNSLSDVDVLVLTEQPRPHVIRLVAGTTRWADVVYVARKQLASFLITVPELPRGYSDWSNACPASLTALDVLHDYTHGLRVSTPWGPSVGESHELDDKLARSWALTNIISARARWHDAAGAHRDQQHMQATYLRSLCFGHCVDAYTGLFGETDINIKWRWSKLARLANTGRDILGLHKSCARKGSIESFTWAEVATLLLDVITLFVEDARFDAPPPQRPGERLEIAHNRWVLVDGNGLSHEIAAPARLN